MQTLTNSQFDIVLIGSGLSSTGVLKAFLDFNQMSKLTKKILIISDARNTIEQYKNGQILRVLGSGGGSRYWHGVYPSDRVINIFKKEKILEISNKKRMHVPRTPPSSHSLLKEIRKKTNISIVSSTVNKIVNCDSQVDIFTEDGSCFSAKLIFMCAGVIGTGGILHRSNVISKNNIIGDHLCGFGGIYQKKFIEDKFNISLDKECVNSGYTVPYIESKERNLMLMFRPARFEMIKPYNQIRTGPSYGTTKIKLLANLIVNFKIGRLIEAFELKFGPLATSKFYAVHFQYEKSDCHKFNAELETIEQNYKASNVLDQVSNLFQSEFGLDKLAHQDLYNGTHLYGGSSRIKDIFDKRVLILDSFSQARIHSTHHTMSIIHMGYDLVSKILTK